MALINGTAGNDPLFGTPGDDTINGFEGDDFITTGDGTDLINPGSSVGGVDFVLVDGTGLKTIDFVDRANGEGFMIVDLPAGFDVTIDGSSNTAGATSVTPGTIVTFLNIANAMANGPFGGLDIRTAPGNVSETFSVDPGSDGFLVLTPGGGRDLIDITGTGFVRLGYSNNSQGITANLDSGLIAHTGTPGAGATVTKVTGTLNALEGSDFDDVIRGSVNDERFILRAGSDFLNGFGGDDMVRYDRFGVTAVDVNLATGTATGLWNGNAFTHTLRNIEDVRGSREEGDALTGNRRDNMLDGRGGDDKLNGRAGADELIGREGQDRLIGGADNDTLTGGDDADRFVFAGAFGVDVITDFDALDGREDIVLRGVASITDFTDLETNHMSQVGDDVVIDAGAGNTITLLDTLETDLDQSDFIF